MHSQPYWNNYFNSGRFFISGCDVMFSLKCILNHYWNNYFNSGRYFNSGCNKAFIFGILNTIWIKLIIIHSRSPTANKYINRLSIFDVEGGFNIWNSYLNAFDGVKNSFELEMKLCKKKKKGYITFQHVMWSPIQYP